MPKSNMTMLWPCKLIFTTMLFILQQISSDALLLKCPLHVMQLQKIVGFRPPIDYLSEGNLIYAPPIASNFKDRDRRNDDYDVTEREDEQPTSHRCWRSCNEDPDCIAYVHLLDTDECYGYSYFERNSRYMAIDEKLPLVADPEAMFYEKTCLRVPEACRGRLWVLTKIPGSILMFHGRKTISTLVTRRECAERCFFETQFKCLSASFAPSYRNNRERFRNGEPHVSLGRCTLNDKDKSQQPDAFRVAPYDEEYMENQCHERPIEHDSCSYELYANSSFIYAEAKYLGLAQKECQALCTHETKFYCQGISFYYVNQVTRSECLLHSEDIVSLGPRSLKLRENSVYMRRVKCLDVKVFCSHNEMTIRYKPKDCFAGKMYASMHSQECQVSGAGNDSVLLRLEIGSEAKESRCGVLRAYEMAQAYQRTFISALVVIQNNMNVQTQGDRLIKVGCILNNATSMIGLNVRDSSPAASEQVPSAIALESSLEYAEHMIPQNGVVDYSGSPHPHPQITLQIVDHSQQHETNDVQIGQHLELRIVAEYTLEQLGEHLGQQLPPLPDFRATSLVAKSQDNQNYVLLIDERGCPTDVSVFPALERVTSSSRTMLRARFHAFKFAGTANVSFDVKIRFCVERCAPANCLNLAGDTWQRRRRQLQQQQPERQLQELRVQNPVYISTVMDILPDQLTNASASQANGSAQLELPLNYNLRVHGPDQINNKSYLYGERGVLLIAGIDDQLHLDNICINQSLLIALFILWLICQVALLFGCGMVLQRYRRLAKLEEERRRLHEEYLEARRVHWADQGGYTL